MPWILLLGALFATYLALAARDFGPVLLGDRRPFDPRFLGRQVWLVGAAGLLIGAFPALEGELPARHAAVVTVALTGTMIATVAIPLRRHLLSRIGATAATAGWGGLLGGLLTDDPAGVVALAAITLALTATHGAALRAGRNTPRIAHLTLGLAVTTAVALPTLAAVRGRPLTAYPNGFWLLALVLCVLAAAAHAAWRREAGAARVATTVTLALLTPLVGVLTWPYALIPAADGSAGATWEHALADPATLRLLAPVAAPALALAALAQALGRWTARPAGGGRGGGGTGQVEGHSPELG